MDSELKKDNKVIIKKKRGRKPKKKSDVVKVLKKRGRKPTGKIISLKKNQLSNLKSDEDCIIAHIPLKSEDINKIENNSKISINSVDTESSINELSLESTTLVKSSNNFNSKYIKHLENQIEALKKINKDLKEKITSSEIFFGDYSVEKLHSKIIVNKSNKFELKNNTNILCWWCCHEFDNTPFPIPEKFYKGKFYVFGNFCSPSCACAFNIDMNDHKLWERNTLIIKFYKELTGNIIEHIYPAPPKQILKKFGGTIDIEEYRKKTKKPYNGRFIIPPMVPLTTLIEESYKDRNKYKWETKINMSKYNNLKKNIKIKRTTTNKKDNILEKIMGIKKIKING